MAEKPPPRFGFPDLEAELLSLAGQATAPRDLDRRTLLERLGRKFGAEEAVLLRRGFDRAYRRLIEGV